MFEVTFLGHQGWQISAGGSNVLVDPLLHDGFGHDPRGNGFDVFPPRWMDFARCPPIDAVLFSHEHEDHFHIPSLERLDRRIPVYLSVRSSSAARRIVGELGFQVHLLRPGEPFAVRELGVFPLPQESLAGSHPGEWDALALHVCDRDGHGSFFTTVDHRPHVGAFELLRKHRLGAALLAYADNESDHAAMFPWAGSSGDGTAALVDELGALLERTIPRDQRPEAILLCANGLAPRGELAWMNRALFHRDPRAACSALRSRVGDVFLAPMPGDTIRLRRGRQAGPVERSSWIGARPESEWPVRGSGARPDAPFSPATGEYELADDRALSRALREFARLLYGSPLFMEMYRLDAEAVGGRHPTMALTLLEGDDVAASHERGGTLWVWDPSDCAFIRQPAGRRENEFVVGARCWATDLLAVLECEMPAASLTMGRLSGWNAAPERVRFDLPNMLHVYCHPLRAPGSFLALYRGMIGTGAPLIFGRRSS